MTQQTVFNGRYELHRRLARGGMAEVFLARDQLLDRPVAVKVLFPEFAADPSFVERFRREAQSAANLNHPNIVSVYDWGQEAGTYFIVMEYVDGRSLATILGTEGPLHPQRAAEVTSDIAAALGFAHRNGVIHRDVKPGNVLISPQGQVKVADFGIARAMGAGTEENLTQAGSVMGTATYFSPEQAQGKPLDPRSDLYSLGVVLYEALTGRPPFSGDSPVAIAYKHVQEQPTPPRQLNVDVPGDLDAIDMKLLAKNPGNRYASAEDLRADLLRFREGQPVLAGAMGATQAVAATRVVPAYDSTTAVPVQDLQPAEAKKRSWPFIVVLILLLLLLAALIYGLSRLLGDGSNTDTVSLQVPAGCCVGKPEAQARATLEAQGFTVTEELQKNDLITQGSVVNVDPSEGSSIDVTKGQKGSAKLIVSSGANTVKMPNVVGSQLDQATNTLKADGFTNITSQQAPSDDPNVQVGEVTQQNPGAGSDVPKDQAIALTVSSGKTKVSVPDVSGKSPAEAGGTLGNAGLTVSKTQNEESETIPSGQVTRTDPTAGTQVEKGSGVTVFVSSGPAQVTVPSVTSLTTTDADAALEGAGFKSAGTCVAGPSNGQDTTVVSQNPSANAKADKGATVSYNYTKSGGC
ncbi:MAG TPA: Stk1 family PASTA domain-containing Ser/Thr kinase [Acidimicrobiales bacterium]|jgi:serine/threonine-protein kinase|nr:Stk1 family PASTA domain-containing Ser/Thr kinase [Acidimicrobiales bacterium]